MNRQQKNFMRLMQTGQITDREVASELNLPVMDVRHMFIKYNRRKKTWRKIIAFILPFDIHTLVSLLNYIFDSE